MRQTLCLLLLACCLVCIIGCGGRQPTEPPETETTAATTQPTTIPATVPATVETTSATTTEATEPEPTLPPEPEDEAAFVRIVDYIPTAKQALAYATVDNFTGCRIYDFTDAYLRWGTVKKLMQVSEVLEEKGVGLVIWDGFRPVQAQAKLWEICPDPTFVSNPVTGRRTHCRGNTVDISLYDLETGDNLLMPTGFDNFTAYADRDYSDVSEEAAKNARLLENTMKKCGFNPYFSEWWHFSDSQDYPVEETFTPAVPQFWVADCEEYISLRDEPDGSVLEKIPKGEMVKLLAWEERYAYVTWNGKTGYVLSSYLQPQEESYLSARLSTVMPTDCYSYEQMISDLKSLAAQYPEQAALDTIGTSELGTPIPVLRIGGGQSRYHVLLQGSIHGREHMTAWLLTALADYWLDREIGSYGDVCYHLIPMSNPDGVAISQSELLTDGQKLIYLSDQEKRFTSESEASYAAQWKANALGTDINRNFPAGWENAAKRKDPSSEKYKGLAPFSSAEAAALRDYTLAYDFDVTISYHASGSVIYHTYGSNRTVNASVKSLAKAVLGISGYPLEDSDDATGAGYKDWAIDALGIPSLTVEIGCGDAPLDRRELESIFVRNYRILPAIARWMDLYL